jgi:hypothetical protein
LEVREPFNLKEEEEGRWNGMMMEWSKDGNKIPHEEGK